MWIAETIAPLARTGLDRLAIDLIRHVPRAGRARRRAERLLSAAGLPRSQRYATWMAPFAAGELDLILDAGISGEVEAQRRRPVERLLDEQGPWNLTDRLLRTDVSTYLAGDLLVKFDIASMANSLETRSPLLDQEVVEYAAGLSPDLKLRHRWKQKYLLKRLAERHIPIENIVRPKMGFGVPIGEWLRGPLRELAADALLSDQAAGRRLLNRTAVGSLWNDHLSARSDNSFPLWTLMMLELWHREFVDRHPSSWVSPSVPLPSTA
jgi:asparagine synthase (glutamine-hydrolysing)